MYRGLLEPCTERAVFGNGGAADAMFYSVNSWHPLQILCTKQRAVRALPLRKRSGLA